MWHNESLYIFVVVSSAKYIFGKPLGAETVICTLEFTLVCVGFPSVILYYLQFVLFI